MTGFMARAGLPSLLLILAVAIVAMWMIMDRWQARVFDSMKSVPDPAAVVAHPSAPVPLPGDPGLPSVADYREFIDRPLFMSTRRPPVVETVNDEVPEAETEDEAEPEEPLPELSDLRLTSVIITPDERHAWFLVSGTDEILRLSMGDTLREWLLHQVEETHVVFRARGEATRLELRPPGRGVDLAPGERAAPRARE